MFPAIFPRHVLRRGLPLIRCSSTSTPSLKLVAELRKRTTATIQKAREALIASHGDISGALEWLERDRVSTGQQKAEKVGHRFAGEGLIGISVLSRGTHNGSDSLGVRAAMVELNCETDFVGRNELFRKLTQDLAFTAAFIAEPSLSPSATDETQPFVRAVELDHLRDAPLILRGSEHRPQTVSEAIRDIITAVGENISIRRAVSFVHDPILPTSGVGLRVASYVHGALAAPQGKTSVVMEAQGKIGALVAVGLRTSPVPRLSELLGDPVFNTALSTLERGLARQIVGLRPRNVRGDGDGALYNQSFDMLATSGGQSVEGVLTTWAAERKMTDDSPRKDKMAGVSVVEFSRWEVGEGLEAVGFS